MIPDFSKYNLALIEENKIIHKSDGKGLRPLFDIHKLIKKKRDLILHDKIVGLASAKIILYYKNIIKVHTTILSQKAYNILTNNNIELSYDLLVENILKKDKSGTCPGELKAEKMTREEYFEFLKGIYRQ